MAKVQCIHCREQVEADATTCPHCRKNPRPAAPPSAWQKFKAVAALAFVLGVAAFVIAVVVHEPERKSPAKGEPRVLAEIDAETSCSELQGAFDDLSAKYDASGYDSAESDRLLDYMDAALERRSALGCDD